MAVFGKVNPTRRDYTVGDPEFAGLQRREETILANLGLSPEFFRGTRVLDAGCGTGDIALLTARWGADTCAFDLNRESVAHAMLMAERTGLQGRCRFVQGSVLAPPFAGPFDLVMCLGVLPHTGDPERAFGRLASLVRPGGYLYIASINTYGFALRRAKRAVVDLLSGGKPERKAALAKILWRNHVARAARFGFRTPDQIAWDNFVAPHLTASVGQWLSWMHSNGLEYVSSFPSFFQLTLPPAHRGAVAPVAPVAPPRSALVRRVKAVLVQFRWAAAFRVGGLASISFLARKR